jgi:hypothetical protein
MNTTYISDGEVSLEQAQELVGGYVTHVPIPSRPDSQMFVDEEGLLKELPVNKEASELAQQTIVGNVIVLSGGARWK